MTRDEAIEIDFQIARKAKAWDGFSDTTVRQCSAAMIDSLIALGVLKIAPPTDVAFKFVGAWNSTAAQSGGPLISSLHVRAMLDKAGLELVEKK